VAVHLAREHALELEALDLRGEPIDIARHRREAGLVAHFCGELGELVRVAQALRRAIDGADGLLEARTLAAELLRALGLVPDGGVLELAADLGQPVALPVVVKGTSSARRRARGDPESGQAVD
jgi:hypothetical protein